MESPRSEGACSRGDVGRSDLVDTKHGDTASKPEDGDDEGALVDWKGLHDVAGKTGNSQML